jgi:outer membrane protein
MKKTTFLKTLGIFFLVQATWAAGYAGTPYTLEQCKQLALNNSLKIENGELIVDAAAETKKAAFTAYFPKISASGTYFRNSKDLFNMEVPFMPGMSISMFDRATVLAVNIMQPLFTGGRIINGNKLATLGKQVEEKKLILTKNEILLETEEQYWLLVTMDEKIKTLDIYSAMLDDLFKQVSDAYKYGLITRNDVLKVSVK